LYGSRLVLILESIFYTIIINKIAKAKEQNISHVRVKDIYKV
jgi:hypothetical protein